MDCNSTSLPLSQSNQEAQIVLPHVSISKNHGIWNFLMAVNHFSKKLSALTGF